MAVKHFDLLLQRGDWPEAVPGIGVLRDEAEGLALAAATDPDLSVHCAQVRGEILRGQRRGSEHLLEVSAAMPVVC